MEKILYLLVKGVKNLQILCCLKCGEEIEIDDDIIELGDIVKCKSCGQKHQFSLDDYCNGETEVLYNVLYLEE